MALIVVADDDKDVRAFLKVLVENQGHDCLDFSNGEDALDALRQNTGTGVLVCDVAMPPGDGRDILETLRNGPPRLRRLPVLLISGQVPEPILADPLKDLRCRFLQKPFSPGQFHDVVCELLAMS